MNVFVCPQWCQSISCCSRCWWLGYGGCWLLVVGCWWLHHDIEMKIAADADIESKIVSLYQHTYVEM
jgi:hypothetical protein